MNPFLQFHWGDVHNKLLTGISVVLSDELPADLVARAEERVAVADTGKKYGPDVAVVEPWQGGFPPVWSADDSAVTTATVTEPIVVFEEPETEQWLEIRTAGGDLITVIEVLSPTNKSELGYRAYRQKQRDLLAAGINLVEIDLIRGGQHVLAVSLDQFEHPPGADYLVCVARQQPGYAGRREVYPASLREPLPTIRVPLREGDPDVPLALQPLIDDCYRTGRYWLTDHRRPLNPPLAAEEAAWVEERLRAAGVK